ncbi:anti-sigma-factor antagonist [Amycolatopsis vancoresmycina DSM 44592]|uniref:Anti-sigma-factor antagonist n=1 Tax=Amycolatopsis vancoresmycina DSM 44592 TaxID=1292037 RepID=R1G0Q7_9PSEU|nr:anti-sigma-factor antagonist [Amycolatopsis vancoresmycina DSM 44592]
MDCGGSLGIGIAVRRIADSVTVVSVAGEIDSSNGDSLFETLSSALPETTLMIADFGEVTFCGSSGLRALLLVSEACADRGADFVLLPSPVVRRAVEACRLGGVLRLAEAGDTVTTLVTGRS